MAALTIALAACSSGPRQPSGPPPWTPNKEAPRDENFRGGPNAMLLQYDANKDGTLTRDELIEGLRTEFARLDADHKSCLDMAQAGAVNEQRLALDQSTATPLQDWNLDNCIDYREFATAAYSLFDSTDRNRDGKITPQEFNPGQAPGSRGARGGAERPAGGRGGGGRGGQGGGRGSPPGGGTPPGQ
jgi:Ca2+-binding EF-hand superfamily protein